MSENRPMKIVIASAGRRAHYIEWFQQALRKQGLTGEVIALEYRDNSAAYGLADQTIASPAYNGPDYASTMREWFAAERPDLFLCLNDYEMHVLSQGLADELRDMGSLVSVPHEAVQTMIFDKYRMAKWLQEHDIPVPDTYLGSDAAAILKDLPGQLRFIVKHRFGSGSAGLQITGAAGLAEAVEKSAETALGPDGIPVDNGVQSVVVQQYLPGTEHGVDGVFSLDGASELLGVVARRTDQQLHGDPEVATTVSGSPFHDDMTALGKLLSPTGSINVDFREDEQGRPLVIDINPRLGGGYPFCHRAGADIPSAIVRSAAGMAHVPELLDYELDVTTVRREEFTVIRRAAVMCSDRPNDARQK